MWWLDSCGDDEVDPDSAVKTMESVGWTLGNLPAPQQDQLIRVVAGLADAETDPGRPEQLRLFPFHCRLVEEALPGGLAD
ncbi:hypothetical protein ACU686_07735 [Yinghuangia aomiensis]